MGYLIYDRLPEDGRNRDLKGGEGKGDTGGVWGPEICLGGNSRKPGKLRGQDGQLG